MRRLAWIPASLFVLLSFAAVAQDQEELKGLYAAVALLNQEQQAVFQQFQMLQELRRANSETFFAGTLRSPRYATEVPNYADVVIPEGRGPTRRRIGRRGRAALCAVRRDRQQENAAAAEDLRADAAKTF